MGNDSSGKFLMVTALIWFSLDKLSSLESGRIATCCNSFDIRSFSTQALSQIVDREGVRHTHPLDPHPTSNKHLTSASLQITELTSYHALRQSRSDAQGIAGRSRSNPSLYEIQSGQTLQDRTRHQSPKRCAQATTLLSVQRTSL